MKTRACARRMAEQTGVYDVMFHANTSTYVPGHTLELIVHVLMLPRACAVRACSHTRAAPMAPDGRQVPTCRAQSALDRHSSFDNAVILFLQTQFRGICSMRAPLHGCTALPPSSSTTKEIAEKRPLVNQVAPN